MGDQPRFSEGAFGRLSFDHMNTTHDRVDWLSAHRAELENLIGQAKRGDYARNRDFFGNITASAPIASTDNRWHYTVQLKAATDSNGAYITDKLDPLTEVLSENELENTATHINGGQPLTLSSMTAPQILDVLPLADGTSVTLRKRGAHWYIIGRDNPTDFDCS